MDQITWLLLGENAKVMDARRLTNPYPLVNVYIIIWKELEKSTMLEESAIPTGPSSQTGGHYNTG